MAGPKSEKIRNKIIAAAEALTARNEKVTNEAVLKEMGSGSLAHVSPVMKEWREQQERTSGVLTEMPDVLKAALDRIGIELWRVVDGEAKQTIAAIQAATDERIAAAEAERDEALKKVADLEARNSALKTALDDQSMAAHNATERAEKYFIDNEKYKIQLENAYRRVEEFQKSAHNANKMVDELQKSVHTMQKQNEKLQAELVTIAKESTRSAKTGAKK